MFLLFISFIHYTFRNTKYNYPKWVKILYLVPSVVVPFILIIMTTIEYWFHFDEGAFKFRRYLDHINTITLCLFSAYLFCRVLGRVAWKQVKFSDENSNEALEKASKLLEQMTKYTILVLVIIIFALAVMIMDELTWNGITFGIDIREWILMLFILYYIDCFINIFCVYLRFSFSAKIYNKLCIHAHKCMMNCCVNCMKKKYEKYNAKINMEKTIELAVITTNKESTCEFSQPNSSIISSADPFLSPPMSPPFSPKSKDSVMSDSEFQD